MLGLILRLPLFALVVGRLGGMIMFQPLIGGLSFPVHIRAAFVFGMAALCTPLVPLPANLPTTALGLALGVAGELLLGAVIGLVVRVIFVGLEMGGLLIAQQAGLAFGQIADPTTGVQSTLLSSFFVQFGTVIFLILGGHRVLLSVVLDTFTELPLLAASSGLEHAVPLMLEAMTLGTNVAIRVAAPVVLTLFLINIALGFVGRTVPQLNILTLGFPIKGLLGLTLLAVTLPVALETFTLALAETFGWIAETCALAGRN